MADNVLTMAYNSLFKADTKAARAEIMKLQTTIAYIGTGMQSAFTAVTNVAKTAGIAFAAVSASALGSMLIVNEFNRNLVHAAAIGNLTTTEMNKLGQSIVDLSVKYGQSASSIASGVVTLTKAGLSSEEIAMSMDSITQAMLANSITFEEAANIAIFATKQFGGSNGFANLTGLMDKMQKVTQETVLDFSELQEGLQYAGSTATLAGVPFEQLLAMLGALSQRAMQAGIGARSVNQMMLSLIDNTDEMQAWIDSMGLGVEVVKDGALNIDELIRTFGELDFTYEDLQKSADIFSDRALRSWGLLITGAEEYVKLLDVDLQNASGTLEGVYQKQMQSLSFQLNRIKSVFMAGFLGPEFVTALKSLLDSTQVSIAELANTIAKTLFIFLQWTVKNGPSFLDVLSKTLGYIVQLVEPLYWMGERLSKIGFNLFQVIIFVKALKTTMFFELLKSYTQVLQSLTKSMVQLNFVQLKVGEGMRAFAIGVAASIPLMAMAAFSAFYMGKAFGESARGIIWASAAIAGAMTAIQLLIAMGPLASVMWPAAVAAGLGVFTATGLAFEYGATKYKKMDDYSGLDTLSSMSGLKTLNLANDNQTGVYTQGAGTAISAGSGSPYNTGTTVNINIGGSFIGDEKKLTDLVIKEMNARGG